MRKQLLVSSQAFSTKRWLIGREAMVYGKRKLLDRGDYCHSRNNLDTLHLAFFRFLLTQFLCAEPPK